MGTSWEGNGGTPLDVCGRPLKSVRYEGNTMLRAIFIVLSAMFADRHPGGRTCDQS